MMPGLAKLVKLGAGGKQILITCLISGLTWAGASGNGLSAPGPVNEIAGLTKLADGVYVRVASPEGNAVSNSGIVVLGSGVLVFDSHFTPEAAEDLLSAIRSVTSKPVRYVVNSHFHPDHTHGNQVFTEAQLISSTSTRRDMLQVDIPSMDRTLRIAKIQLGESRRDLDKEGNSDRKRRLETLISAREEFLRAMSRLAILAPSLTLDDSMEIQDGSPTVQLLFLGAGHTDGDIVLLLPSAKIAFLGDLFFNKAIPNVQDASVLGWMRTLEEVLKLDAEIFVPGHGPVGSRNDLSAFLSYFEKLRNLIEPAVARGDVMEQVIQDVQEPVEFFSYSFQNFFLANVQKMYVELKALKLASTREGPERPFLPVEKTP